MQQFVDDGEDLLGMQLEGLAGQLSPGGQGQLDQLPGDLLVQASQGSAELIG